MVKDQDMLCKRSKMKQQDAPCDKLDNSVSVSVKNFVCFIHSHGLNTGFFILESYPLLSYLEYPLLLLQNFVLLIIIGDVTGNLLKHLAIILSFVLFISAVGMDFLPRYLVLGGLVRQC